MGCVNYQIERYKIHIQQIHASQMGLIRRTFISMCDVLYNPSTYMFTYIQTKWNDKKTQLTNRPSRNVKPHYPGDDSGMEILSGIFVEHIPLDG